MARSCRFAPPPSLLRDPRLGFRFSMCKLSPPSSSGSPGSNKAAEKVPLRLRNCVFGTRKYRQRKKELGKLRACSRADDGGEGVVVRTLLIDNYDSYTYNIYQELSVVNRLPPVVIYNDEWTWEYLRRQLYEEKSFDSIVISPGPGSPACPTDIGICLQLLLECEDIPILGVCLGHQALGFVHGARIVHAPEPVHGRLSEVEHNQCELFEGIPSGRKAGFKVVRYHSLVIDSSSLPKDLMPIAWTTSTKTLSFLDVQDPDISHSEHFKVKSQLPFGCHSNILMGIKHSTRPHFGVQFHPESIATCYGRQIFENFKRFAVNDGLRSFQHPARKRSYKNFQQDIPMEEKPLNAPSSMDCLHIQEHADSLYTNTEVKHLKLHWKKLCGLAKQVGGPENIFLEMFGSQNGRDTFWLDSSSTDKRRARFSFMGGRGGELWKQLTFSLSDHRNSSTRRGGYLTTRDAKGSLSRTFLKDGFLDFMDKEIRSFHYDKGDYKGLPFDFCGGFVGYIGYNLKVECGASTNLHNSSSPDACFFFSDNIIAIDHTNDDVYVLSICNISQTLNSKMGIEENHDKNSKNSWLDETTKKLLTLKNSRSLEYNRHRPALSGSYNSGFVVERSRHQYMRDVRNCLKYIRDGESYELCLTTQMKRGVRDIDALGLYLDLRNQNPAPYAAWLNFSKDNLSICCSSPERFLRLDGSGTLEAKPIKGTISRGATREEDECLRLQLQYSEKDQAENLMIVDLLRNDLGRVCESGTVHVPRLMEVESYATVHTLVSTIQGKKKSSFSPIDCVRVAFPGGSMTGAPKLRSMEILDSIEQCSRGVYSGSIGFFSYNQTFDLNIVIRTVVIHNGEASVGAGGAVVALSNPQDEYEEMLLKARAPTQAVEKHLKNSDPSDKRFTMAT